MEQAVTVTVEFSPLGIERLDALAVYLKCSHEAVLDFSMLVLERAVDAVLSGDLVTVEELFTKIQQDLTLNQQEPQ